MLEMGNCVKILDNCCEQCAQLNVVEKILVNCGYCCRASAFLVPEG